MCVYVCSTTRHQTVVHSVNGGETWADNLILFPPKKNFVTNSRIKLTSIHGSRFPNPLKFYLPSSCVTLCLFSLVLMLLCSPSTASVSRYIALFHSILCTIDTGEHLLPLNLITSYLELLFNLIKSFLEPNRLNETGQHSLFFFTFLFLLWSILITLSTCLCKIQSLAMGRYPFNKTRATFRKRNESVQEMYVEMGCLGGILSVLC